MSSIMRLLELLILDLELSEKDREIVSQWTTNMHGKCKKKWLLCYPVFISQQYSVNLQWTILQTPWCLKDLEPAEDGQRTFVHYLFQFEN